MKKETMKTASVAAEVGVAVAGGIMEQMKKKKEEKSFFDNNKNWIFLIILSIFVVNLDYIFMFESVILNSMINIIYGIIVLILLCVFCSEEKKIFKTNSTFIKILAISILVLGIINSFYHVGYAISNLITVI